MAKEKDYTTEVFNALAAFDSPSPFRDDEVQPVEAHTDNEAQ